MVYVDRALVGLCNGPDSDWDVLPHSRSTIMYKLEIALLALSAVVVSSCILLLTLSVGDLLYMLYRHLP